MATHWLAIDWNQGHASFDELRHRRVVAQGWPGVPSLETLLTFVEHSERQAFMDAVAVLERLGHQHTTRANRVPWDLLSMKAGDVVVGIEGTKIKGICQLQHDGHRSYRHDAPDVYNYAHTIGFPVEWVLWDVAMFGAPPKPSGQGADGVESLIKESERVTDAWNRHLARRTPHRAA